MIAPTIGRVVIYRLTERDLERMSATVSRSPRSRFVNAYEVGDAVAADVVRVLGQHGTGPGQVNLRLKVDGNIAPPWVGEVSPGPGVGQWSWPVHVESGAEPRGDTPTDVRAVSGR